jgi:hypothetical protein
LAHTRLAPEIIPGCEGITFIVADKVCAGLLPHELFAVTDIVPPTVPVVAVIELVIELPVQPEGNVQV